MNGIIWERMYKLHYVFGCEKREIGWKECKKREIYEK
jgi:hypothetical protein